MTNTRPAECPACGHDRLRRRPIEESVFVASGSRPVEEWVCGLCRYEWSTPIRELRATYTS